MSTTSPTLPCGNPFGERERLRRTGSAVATLRERLRANKSGNPTTVATTEGTSATHCLPNALLTLLRRYRCANTAPRLRS
ncbi:hypothetical protein [Nostoc sp. 106C]|uniref:hypothetical protein n=1 Tax=Nostoc sp. 106C TaxID=1932667 RepID=UPI001180CE4C|nr:hypothetical protein [Nostoc sp. 106C]